MAYYITEMFGWTLMLYNKTVFGLFPFWLCEKLPLMRTAHVDGKNRPDPDMFGLISLFFISFSSSFRRHFPFVNMLFGFFFKAERLIFLVLGIVCCFQPMASIQFSQKLVESSWWALHESSLLIVAPSPRWLFLTWTLIWSVAPCSWAPKPCGD